MSTHNSYHNKFHKVVADISSGFISANSSNIDEKIDDMLKRIIDIFQLDRAHVVSLTEDLKLMVSTHEHCVPGVKSIKHLIDNISLESVPWWKKSLFEGDFIHIHNVDELPSDAAAERAILKKMEISSLMCVPIYIDRSVAGFIGLDSVTKHFQWDTDDINLIQILANTIAEAKLKIAAESDLIHLSRMQQIIMNIAQTYINIPLNLVDSEIMKSLKEMAEYVDADRSYIFRYDFNANTTSNTHEWCAEGISAEIDNLQNVPTDFIPDWIEKHSKGEDFSVTDVLTLPDLGPGCLRDILEPQGIKSIITVPMLDSEELVGFVGFDSVLKHHTYTKKEKSLLNLFAQMLVNVKKRAESEKMLTLAKEQAEAASRAKSEFLANMSHEIRTPLNSVIGFTELLNRTPLNISQKRFVENANISAQSLLEIINDILDFSKIEAGKLELAPIKTDIVEIVEQVCEMVKYQAIQKELELLLNIQPDIPRYGVVDPIRLKQILVNLISNAIKFTERGEVELRVKFEEIGERQGRFTFYIRDTGIGISQDEQKRLFKAFTQADSSTTRKFGGTGLGLVISNHLAEKMGDRIHMKSTFGKGSEFFFSIDSEIDSVDKIGGTTLVNIKRVLIVDDNSNNRTILEQTFKSWNIECISCSDGLEAIRIVKVSDPFDLIVIDFKMPLINGIDTIRMLRNDTIVDKDKLPVIIMCSSDDDSLINEESRKHGMIYKLVKPVKISELFDYLLNLSNTGVINPTRGYSSESISSKKSYITNNKGLIKSNPIVLIAEDVQMNMILIKTLVSSYIPGAIIFEARNGLDAIQMAAVENPDIILMDVQMPEADGLEATAEIRRQESGKKSHIPIIALTAGASQEDRERCIEAGMDDYLTKPIEQPQLHKVLEKYLKNRLKPKGDFTDTNFPSDTTHHFNKEEMMRRVDNNSEILTDLLNSLEEEMEEALTALEHSIKSNNSEISRKVTHKIKGVALNMSFTKLSQIIKELENSIVNDPESNSRLFSNLIDEWNILKKIIYQ
ncbi:MAG: histidine kinase [Bacteroidetes bacterium HGW-Bacteroidetes-8]|jgi:signal transduction histidine kinase/CheY-like chemotaxis protein/HPt (histidine-containing phosphotransfer) domain-containing protein|nr:MAG: histidine kinase [Bacteroidetes bacterium HGW-Bacteroidetes-8]